MFRRVLIFITLLAVILSLAVVPTLAATPSQEQTMRAAIRSQFDAFAKPMATPDMDTAAVKQLLGHAAAGKGSFLTVQPNDPVVRTMMNTQQFPRAFEDFVMAALTYMQTSCEDRLLIGGSVNWHEYKCSYSASVYEYNSTEDSSDDIRYGYNLVKVDDLSLADNENDKAMFLVAGTVSYRMWITRTRNTGAECTYNVKFRVSDGFDFNGDYSKYAEKGYNTTISELITLTGKLLDHGLIDTYEWSFTTGLQVTVPSYCDHSSYDYRWELQGSDLVSVTADGFSANPLTRFDGQMKETDKYPRYYYQLQNAVHLMHDRPWVVEWAMGKPSRNVMLTADKTINNSSRPFLLKTSKYIACGWYNRPFKSGQSKATYSAREQYGINYYDLGFTNKGTRVYRLENRIAADGSNMIWLFIDGQEVAALNTYMPYNTLESKLEETGKIDNWASGQDFHIRYIGNGSMPLREANDILYLQIWEDGVPGENPNYLASSVAAPTCTDQGCTAHTCALCGAQFRDSYVPALGHSYAAVQTVAATCTEQGYTVYRCSTCGDSYNGDFVDATGHSWDGGVVTKPATFLEPGEKTFTCHGCQQTRQESYIKPLMDLAGTSMTLGDSLSVSFVLDTAPLEGDGAYAVITKAYADGREPVAVTVPQSEWQPYSKTLYYFSFDGVAAKEMCDTLSVQVYDAQGNKISNPYTDSIRDYAMRMLGKPDVIADEALRTLYVDMLNYGAAAQVHFAYAPENLANSQLTETQRTYASEPPATMDLLFAGPGRAGTTLTLKSRITLDFLFSTSVLGDPSSCYAIVAYSDHYGKPVEIRIADLQSYDNARICISVPGLAVADYTQMVTCTVYNAAGDPVAWSTDSMEGYIHRMTGKLPAIVEAIAKFGSSAYQYFH